MNAEDIAIKLTEHEGRLNASERRIKDLEDTHKQIQDLTIAVKEMAISLTAMCDEQKEQSVRLSELEKQPADRWNKVTTTLLTSFVSACAGALAVGIVGLLAGVI